MPTVRCAEEGCDRPALEADARCGLHSARLGPLRDPRPPIHVVVPAEHILEAPAPVDRTTSRFRTRTTITWVMVAAEAALLVTLYFHSRLAEPDWDLHKALFALFVILCAATPLPAVALVWVASTWRRRAFAWTSLLVTLTPWALAAYDILRSPR